MNVFYLDTNPQKAAEYHCDKHVVKMILESAQLLSTAWRVLEGDQEADIKGLYRETHTNHPCAVWVRESRANYNYVYQLFEALCQEYTRRYGKEHKTARLLDPLYELPFGLPEATDYKPTNPPQCMPKEYHDISPVVAYRTYYIQEKAYMAKWTKRDKPFWWTVE